MSSYNAYLPAHAPLSLVSGEATLVGDLQLGPKSLRGELLLLAKGVRVAHEPDGDWLAISGWTC
jgi:hypothetical protein